MTNNKVILKVPSQTESISEVSSKIMDDLSHRNIGENVLFDIRLCVEEAMRNAIVHGNKSRIELEVAVAYWVEEGAVTIEIEDQGQGFDPDRLPDPTRSDNILKGSGRGVYLIKRLMSEAAYNDTGNRIRMVKRFK